MGPIRIADSNLAKMVDLVGIERSRTEQVQDLYHGLLELSVPALAALFCCGFIGFNLLFAWLYTLQPGAVTNAQTGAAAGFLDAFFFSVQTVATIGYGVLAPQTLLANLLVTVEIICGVMGFALSTGLVFTRFSRPTSRIVFTRNAVVAPLNGVQHLMFRAANQRRNMILQASARLVAVLNETTLEGVQMRRFHELGLSRAANPVFALTWTVMHAIDADSPLYGLTEATVGAAELEVIVIMSGVDEAFSQQIYARHSYLGGEIRWDHRMADVISRDGDGRRVIDFTQFDELIPVTMQADA